MTDRVRKLRQSWRLVLPVLLMGLTEASAAPIVYSTNGQFDLPTGKAALTGVTDEPPSPYFPLGSVPVAGIPGALGNTPFHLRFQFNEGLPPIDVAGTVRSLGYNTDWPIINPVVSTAATEAQRALYPLAFRDLISHPEWLHTTSFRSDLPTMGISASVHPEDPNEIRPVPEPASAVVFAVVVLGIGWRSGRRRAEVGRRRRASGVAQGESFKA